jgi:hypothetical protein
MHRNNLVRLSGISMALLFGCSGSSARPQSDSLGGAVANGGTTDATLQGSGGAANLGGAATDGGSPPNGGAVVSGGAVSSGGSPGSGGTFGSGGAGTGGKVYGNGGTTFGGGTVATGGMLATGGAGTGNAGKATGGAATGGKAGGTANAGAPATGGAATGTGGAPTTCAAPAPTDCTAAPTIRITEIDVGATVVVNEIDGTTTNSTKLLSISPITSGGSRVAWMGNDNMVHITTVDCNDHVVSTFGLPAMDYGDIYADDSGGVLLVARDAQGGGTLNCGAPTNLCGTPPSPAIPCYDEYMVRFDGTTETWATKLTTSSASLPPYSTDPTGADVYFIWWYAHRGRLAFDGTNYAGYYGAAISTSEACTTGSNTAINIHQGDEMRVVSPTGAMLTGHNSFVWGCSHSGFEKIVWDPAAARFVMICRSDAYPHVGLNVNAANLVSAIDAANSSVSNLVLASGGGYWVLVSNVGALHLFKFTTGASTADISLGNGNKPHLVTYGSRLLASWVPGTSGNMVGQVLDAATGATIGATFPIAVPSNQYQDFRNYSDGSAAYVAPGSTATKLKIVRAMPCQ